MKTIAISILLVYCSFLNGQTEKPEKSYWLNSGLGFYGAFQSGGFTWNVLSFQRLKETDSWKLKILYSEDGSISLASTSKRPHEHFYQADLLLGKVTTGNAFRFSIHGGLGFIGGVIRGDYLHTENFFFTTEYYEKEEFFTLCIPVETSLRLISIKNSIDLGLTLYGNLNTRASQWGITSGIFIRIN
jgi:hypothetical protein